jgi:hypothetical protein
LILAIPFNVLLLESAIGTVCLTRILEGSLYVQGLGINNIAAIAVILIDLQVKNPGTIMRINNPVGLVDKLVGDPRGKWFDVCHKLFGPAPLREVFGECNDFFIKEDCGSIVMTEDMASSKDRRCLGLFCLPDTSADPVSSVNAGRASSSPVGIVGTLQANLSPALRLFLSNKRIGSVGL